MNLAHFAAADAEHELGDADQRAAYLARLDLDPATRRTLARKPPVLGWLERVASGAVFVTTPETAANHARAVAQAALQAVGELAGSLHTTKAGRASGSARRADIASRDRIIRELWADTDPRQSDSARLNKVQKRLWRQHREELSTRQIKRIAAPD